MTSIVQQAHQTATELGKLYEEFRDCNSDRSMVQLRHFVVGKNETPGRKWLQVMTELRIAWTELRRMMLERSKLSEAEGDLLRKEQLDFDMDAKVKECGKLLKLRSELKPYTAEEIEMEEAEYYAQRLRHQAVLDMASRVTGIGVGNLQSMEQLGVVHIELKDGKLLMTDTVGLFQNKLEDK